jgi:hypothetical protein
MQRNRLALALAILTLVIYAVLSLAFQDFVRENIVIPIAFLVWIARQVIRSIHQTILLSGLILIGFVIAIMSLRAIWEITPPLKKPVPLRPVQSRYRFWLGRCGSMYRSDYSLDMMSSELRRLLLSVLSYQEHRSTSEVENLIIQRGLDVPPAVYDFIVMRRLAEPDDSAARNMFLARLREYLRRRFALGELPGRDEIDQHLEQIIAYIEDRLEGTQ